MGMGRVELELLVHEHACRPISGDVIAVGRQHIGCSSTEILEILDMFGVQPRTREFEVDTLNSHHSPGEVSILDASFFRSFTDARYSVADISPYEGADHVFDICGELPDHLAGRFDFIIDGGSLDNIFDPLSMVRNMTKMLKPGGRMLIYAWSNSFPSAYLKITPDWIMDYCAVNEFADCKVYASRNEAPGGDQDLGRCVELFNFDPLLSTAAGPAYEAAFVSVPGYSSTYCIAEKGERTTSDRTAVQKHYRGSDLEPYLSSALRFHNSPRPLFSRPGSTDLDFAPISLMPTVSPVCRFGRPADFTGHELLVRKLNKLNDQLFLLSTSSRSDISKREAFVHDKMQQLSKQVHDQHQDLSRRMYELQMAVDETRPALAATASRFLMRQVRKLTGAVSR